MALDLTKAAHASSNTELELADQRGRLTNLFSLFLISPVGELRQSPGHCVSVGPDAPIPIPLL